MATLFRIVVNKNSRPGWDTREPTTTTTTSSSLFDHDHRTNNNIMTNNSNNKNTRQKSVFNLEETKVLSSTHLMKFSNDHLLFYFFIFHSDTNRWRPNHILINNTGHINKFAQMKNRYANWGSQFNDCFCFLA